MHQLKEIFDNLILKKFPKESQLVQLHREKQYIIENTLENLNFKHLAEYSHLQLEEFSSELERSIEAVYINFPCLIDENNCPDLESIKDPELKYEILAKNLFKVLTYGTPTNQLNDTALKSSFLYDDVVINHFSKKRDPKFSACIRSQLQKLFNTAFEKLQNAEIDEKKYEIFQNQLLSSYPFWDPDTKINIFLPQKINGQWSKIEYKWGKHDISPRSGLLASLLRDENRIYAYTLEPVSSDEAKSHLLLMGTTYPSGQGADLAALENFRPFNSVGEGHNLKLVFEWLDKQKDKSVNITGHSKGATMAMIVAALYANKINYASCLNPAGLSDSTLKHLNTIWLTIPKKIRALIEVFVQKGDPVFPLEKGFLEDTKITKVIASDSENPAFNFTIFGCPLPFRTNYQAHIFIGAGHPQGIFLDSKLEKENNSYLRQYFNDIKFVYNFFVYSQKYTSLVVSYLYRDLKEFIGKLNLYVTDIFSGILSLVNKAHHAPMTFIANFVAIPFKLTHAILTGVAYLIDYTLKTIASLINFVVSVVSVISALTMGSLKFPVSILMNSAEKTNNNNLESHTI